MKWKAKNRAIRLITSLSILAGILLSILIIEGVNFNRICFKENLKTPHSIATSTAETNNEDEQGDNEKIKLNFSIAESAFLFFASHINESPTVISEITISKPCIFFRYLRI